MRSDKQKDTSRRNGAKSRGPLTAAGKQRSSANSYKHGISSQALLIPGESQADLDAHFGAYRDRFNPADAVELDLVDNLASITWRRRRLWRREGRLSLSREIIPVTQPQILVSIRPYEWTGCFASTRARNCALPYGVPS